MMRRLIVETQALTLFGLAECLLSTDAVEKVRF
jgi:hypothetical protein